MICKPCQGGNERTAEGERTGIPATHVAAQYHAMCKGECDCKRDLGDTASLTG